MNVKLVEVLSGSKPLAVTLATAIALALIAIVPSSELPDWLADTHRSARPYAVLVMLVTVLFFADLGRLNAYEWLTGTCKVKAEKMCYAVPEEDSQSLLRNHRSKRSLSREGNASTRRVHFAQRAIRASIRAQMSGLI